MNLKALKVEAYKAGFEFARVALAHDLEDEYPVFNMEFVRNQAQDWVGIFTDIKPDTEIEECLKDAWLAGHRAAVWACGCEERQENTTPKSKPGEVIQRLNERIDDLESKERRASISRVDNYNRIQELERRADVLNNTIGNLQYKVAEIDPDERIQNLHERINSLESKDTILSTKRILALEKQVSELTVTLNKLRCRLKNMFWAG